MRRERLLRDMSGQMAVELAALIPVVIVVALTIYNLSRFVERCAVFDRASLLAVNTVGVSPPGSESATSGALLVRDSVLEQLGYDAACEVEVSVEPLGSGRGKTLPSLGGKLQRFTCTLTFRPWPSSFVLAGVPYRAPLVLRHERSLVVSSAV